MTTKTVLVTGAGGFIARHLGARLAADGYRVVGTTTGATMPAGFDKIVTARFGDSLAPALEGEAVTAVVHAATWSGPDEYAVNVDGTGRWMQEARDHGAGLQIYLSSLSAEDPASDYGRVKRELEGRTTALDGVGFRLAVVVGDGGMFERMRASLAKAPVVPLLDNGSAPVYILGIDFLCDVIAACIASDGAGLRGRVWHLQQPTRYTLREVLTAIRREFGYSCRFVPVPSLPVLWAVTLAERIGLRLPVTATNLKGLRTGRDKNPPSDFARFDHPEEPLDALVAAAARATRTPRE